MARLSYADLSPDRFKAMIRLETYIRHCGLERPLLDLVKLRASQINGCAYCIDMHWKDARAAGETEIRLYSLDAWRAKDRFTRSGSGQRWNSPRP